MPALPEVQALVDFLGERTAGLAVAEVELASFSVLKTFDPPPSALAGAPVDRWSRHDRRSPLSDVVELEALSVAVEAKRLGWVSLRASVSVTADSTPRTSTI